MKTIKTCTRCHGSGRVQIPNDAPHNRVCGQCHGQGTVRARSILSSLVEELQSRAALRLMSVLCLFGLIGCIPPTDITAQVTPVVKPVELKITLDGEGKINVGGGAEITAKSLSSSSPTSRVCGCGCNQEGCPCSRGVSSAASTANTIARSEPQSVTRYERRTVCENGVCRVVQVPVSVAKGVESSPAAMPKRLAAPSTHGGPITVYVGGSPACLAMQRDLSGRDDIVFVTGSPPEINGNRWHPTAVKPDGSRWSPARAGWDSNSLRLFEEWLRGG